jgi:ParB-like chromosome segregation protein Spo0J
VAEQMDQSASTFEYLPLTALVPNATNPRSHSRRQIRAIANSIKAFGFNAPILIDSKRQIVAGHGRFAAAQLLGLEKVPTVSLQHLTDAQAMRCRVSLNDLCQA